MRDAGTPGYGAAPLNVLGRCHLHAVRASATGARAPVYRCGVDSPAAPPTYLMPHPERREWSFTPDASGSHSPRYGFLGAYAGGQPAVIAGFSGVVPPLSSRTEQAPATWRFWSPRGMGFTREVQLVLIAAPLPAELAVPVSALPDMT